MNKTSLLLLKLLKAASWTGIVLTIVAMATMPLPQKYILEAVGFIIVVLYAYQRISWKIPVIVIAAIFSMLYIFVNVSLPDFFIWAIILVAAILYS